MLRLKWNMNFKKLSIRGITSVDILSDFFKNWKSQIFSADDTNTMANHKLLDF